MATEAPETFTGVLLLCRFVAVFDFESPVGGSAYVARLWLGVAGGEQSSNPAVIGHALLALAVFAALPLDSVIVLIKWLASGALGARLHRCPFSLTLPPLPCPLAAPAPESLGRASGVCGVAARCSESTEGSAVCIALCTP